MASPEIIHAREKTVLEQYYQHIRHVENYRHNFTNMLLIFIAALLAAFSQIKPEFLVGVSVLMLVVSLVGFILSLKVGDLVYAYTEAINCIITRWGVPNYMCKLGPRTPFRSMSDAYKFLYLFALALWSLILGYNLRSL